MNIDNYKFIHEMKVRDYECDLQGIVNNANYQHFMEHSRHELLDSLGVNFGKLHEDGIDAMVHMKHIGHPLPGDFLYHPDYSIIGRQALHSYRLQFKHPITQKELEFIAPLPDDMKQIKWQNLF